MSRVVFSGGNKIVPCRKATTVDKKPKMEPSDKDETPNENKESRKRKGEEDGDKGTPPKRFQPSGESRNHRDKEDRKEKADKEDRHREKVS